jgi:hypothetical protein
MCAASELGQGLRRCLSVLRVLCVLCTSFAVLQQLQNDNLPAAQQQYQQLCDLLGVTVSEGDGQLEPLRTLLHLKVWL